MLKVSPDQILTVSLQRGHAVHHINVVSCRYIQARIPVVAAGVIVAVERPTLDPLDRAVVAVEILYDSCRPNPSEPYEVDVALLDRLVVSPLDLLKIRPYATATPAPTVAVGAPDPGP